MARVKAVGHEDRLTLVEHLDELRTRIIICVAALVVAMSLCFWQNEALLDIANGPVPEDVRLGGLITLGPAEAFTTTLTSERLLRDPPLAAGDHLPGLRLRAAGVLEARSRRAILPLMLLAPALFIAGVVFAYFVVLPPAIDFLSTSTTTPFNNQLRARDYYTFFATMLIALGLIFELPLAILAVSRLGIVTPEQLAANRRYAVLIIAILAALLPSIDPVTLILEIVPIFLLFELSIVLARFLGRPAAGDAAGVEPPPHGP